MHWSYTFPSQLEACTLGKFHMRMQPLASTYQMKLQAFVFSRSSVDEHLLHVLTAWLADNDLLNSLGILAENQTLVGFAMKCTGCSWKQTRLLQSYHFIHQGASFGFYLLHCCLVLLWGHQCSHIMQCYSSHNDVGSWVLNPALQFWVQVCSLQAQVAQKAVIGLVDVSGPYHT